MKKLIGLLLLLTAPAFALLDVDRQEIFFRNFLTNPGFEFGIQGAVGTNALPTIESVNYATGKRALKFLATAQNGYVNLRDVPINIDVSRLQYSFYYKTTSASTVKVELRDAGTDALLASSNLLPPSASYFKKETVTFTGTPGDSYYLRIVDTAASSWVAFYLDDVYVGEEVANAAANVPQFEIGMVMPFVSTTCPAGWIATDGSAVSRTVYANLFGVIASTYGNGDGSTTFNLPDYRGMFLRGAGVNGTYSLYSGGSLGAYSADSMQGHKHDVTDPGHTHSATPSGSVTTTDQTAGVGLVARDNTVSSSATTGLTVQNPSSDGTNGTPRVGAETKPASYSVLYCVKH